MLDSLCLVFYRQPEPTDRRSNDRPRPLSRAQQSGRSPLRRVPKSRSYGNNREFLLEGRAEPELPDFRRPRSSPATAPLRAPLHFPSRTRSPRPFSRQLDEVVDDVGIFEAVIGEAADVDLVGAVAAAGEADVGLARLARAIDDATDGRDGQRRRGVLKALLEPLDDIDDPELLAGAGRARGHRGAAAASVERLQHLEATLTSSTGSADSETRIVSPIPTRAACRARSRI
jgi:hypothetical protein